MGGILEISPNFGSQLRSREVFWSKITYLVDGTELV